MKHRVLIFCLLLVLALLLSACGGKQETALSEAAASTPEASGAAGPAPDPGASAPAGQEGTDQTGQEQSEPADPEPTDPEPAPRTDCLYYIKSYEQTGENSYTSTGALYYSPAPEAEPILVDERGFEDLDYDNLPYPTAQEIQDFSMQRSADGKTVCIVSSCDWRAHYTTMEIVEMEGQEMRINIYHGLGYNLSLIRNGTELTRISELVSAHGMTADGSLVYYLHRSEEDPINGPKTLMVYDVEAGTGTELEPGVTYLYVFPSGGAVYRRADGTLCFRKDGEVRTIGSFPGEWETGNGQDYYRFGRCDGAWDCAATPDGGTLYALDPEARVLYTITADGRLTEAAEGVGAFDGLCADGSAYFTTEHGISRWNGIRAAEVWTGDPQTLETLTTGTGRPLWALKSETELVLLTGDAARTFPQTELSGAALSPDESLLYFWANEGKYDYEHSLFTLEPDAGEPELYEAHADIPSTHSGTLCFLDGQPLYFKNLDRTLYFNNPTGDLYWGRTLVHENVTPGMEMGWMRKSRFTPYFCKALFFMEIYRDEENHAAYRSWRFDGMDSEALPADVYVSANDGRGGAILYRRTAEQTANYQMDFLRWTDGGLYPMAENVGTFYVLSYYGK